MEAEELAAKVQSVRYARELIALGASNVKPQQVVTVGQMLSPELASAELWVGDLDETPDGDLAT